MFEVGFSKIRLWRRCPKAYEYAEVRQIQAKRRAAAPFRGTILHRMLEAHDNADEGDERKAGLRVLRKYEDEYAALFEEEREFYGENFISDIRRIYEGYLNRWRGEPWTVLGTEGEVRTPLVRGIEFVGHYDLRVYTREGSFKRLWLVDRKSHKVIPDAEERFGNTQLILYAWAWNRECADEDDMVDGVIWDYLRTKAPTIPEVLKKTGGLTQRKDIDTDVVTYEQAIDDNKLKHSDYREILEHIRQREDGRFYQRVPMPLPSKAMLKTILREVRETAIIMNEVRVYPRNMTSFCPATCEFYRLCKAELAGIDAAFVEKADYEPREDTQTAEAD